MKAITASLRGRDMCRLTLEDELRLTREVERAEVGMARAVVRAPGALGVLAGVGDGVSSGVIRARDVTRIAAHAPGAVKANRARLIEVLGRARAASGAPIEADLGSLAAEIASLRLHTRVLDRAAAAMGDADAR